MPVDPGYFENEILYDNVLIGDYQQLDRANNFAQGNTLVHIRAIPEGGLSGSAQTSFRRTFYSRFQNGGTTDRRQPLPSTFAARWINGGVGELKTSVKIWREGVTNATAGCAVSPNSSMEYPDIVRFDDEENPTVYSSDCTSLCPDQDWRVPSVLRIDVTNGWWEPADLPPNTSSAPAGWMYMNLHDGRSPQRPNGAATQAWVVLSMSAEGRFSVDFDGTSLGNGCSPLTYSTDEEGGLPAIGPAPNVNPGRSPNP